MTQVALSWAQGVVCSNHTAPTKQRKGLVDFGSKSIRRDGLLNSVRIGTVNPIQFTLFPRVANSLEACRIFCGNTQRRSGLDACD